MIKILQRKIEMELETKKKLKIKQNKSTTNNNNKKDEEKDMLSPSIKFEYSNEDGRYAVAEKSIKAGEIIINERPHCSVLLEDFTKTHCQNCFKRTVAPIACPTCSNVIFCSSNCLDVAMKSYHKIECGILSTFWKSGASITCYMALRIMSQKSESYFTNLREEIYGELTSEFIDT